MKKKILLGAIILAVVALSVGATLYRNSKPAYRSLKGAVVTKGTIGEEVYASGRLEFGEKQEVYAPFAGKVKSVSVKLGDKVQAGQALFEMDTIDLKKQIDTAKLNLAGAKADLDQANLSRKYALEDAKGAMDNAAAALEQVKNGAQIPGMDGRPMSVNAAQDNYDKAKEAYDRLADNPSGGGQMSLVSLQNRVQQAEAALKDLQDQLAAAVVKAPAGGTVVNLAVVAGTSPAGAGLAGSGGVSGLVAGGQGSAGSLVTIANLDKLKARLKVNEIDSVKVQPGQKAKVSSDAIDKEYSGSVESIAPLAVTSASARGEETTVEVMVSLDNSTGLKPGYNVNVSIQTAEHAGILLLPSDAVADRDGKKVVFVEANGAAVEREVKLGISGDTQVEAMSGVNEGDKVVLDPSPNLKQGDQVKINE